MTNYKVKFKVKDEPGVLARISVLLRKFNINIKSMEVHPIENEKTFSEMTMVMETDKTPQGFETVTKKLENLVTVVELNYEKISG